MAINKLNFTQQNIEKLPPAASGKRDVYYDTLERYLLLIVTSKGNKTYYVQRTVQGRQMREALGDYGDMSIKEARDKAGDFASKLAKGKTFDEIRGYKKQDPTLQEYWEDYLENHAKLRRKSWQYDKSNFDGYVAGTSIAKLKLHQIRLHHAQDLHNSIGRQRGRVIANRVIELLRSVFYKAMKLQVTSANKNPFVEVDKFEEKPRERFLQPDELPRFFAALDKCTHESFRDYVLISLFTGVRKMNVLSMKWEHIDFVHAVWRLPETKNGKSLNVPLIPEVVEILNRRHIKRESPYVFPTVRPDSKTPYWICPNKPWVSLMKAAGFMDKEGKWIAQSLTFHDLRRSCASWQTIAGANTFTVGASLGHSSPKSTQIYARLTNDHVRTSLANGAKIMKSHIENKS